MSTEWLDEVNSSQGYYPGQFASWVVDCDRVVDLGSRDTAIGSVARQLSEKHDEGWLQLSSRVKGCNPKDSRSFDYQAVQPGRCPGDAWYDF